MTAHELARQLLEGPDVEMMLHTNCEVRESEVRMDSAGNKYIQLYAGCYCGSS